jgi:hypothetical protein
MNSVRWLSGFAVAILVGPALGAEPQIKTILLPEVEARSGASEQYYATCKLHYGDPVDVVGIENVNWLKIKPPIDSFDWVNAADVDISADGKTATVQKKTHLRRGSALPANSLDTVMPEDLVKGELLAVLPGAPQNAGKEVLIRVAPPSRDCRYIPMNAVENAAGAAGQPLQASQPVLPSFGSDTPPPSMPGFGQQANLPGASTPPSPQGSQTSGQPSFAATSPNGAQPAIAHQNARPNQSAWFGEKGQARTDPGSGLQPGQTVVPAGYQPSYTQPQGQFGEAREAPPSFGSVPQEPARTQYSQTPTNSGGGRRASGTYGAVGGAPSNQSNPYSVSQSPQMAATFSNDPMWVQAEKFEEVGDVHSAIRCYDEVGRTYGQTDPNLALRAMNRAQYLRNQISAGVAPQGPLTRSAKPVYGDTTTNNGYPNSYVQQSIDSPRRRQTTAESNIYPAPQSGQFLPNETTVVRQKAPQVEEIGQPNAKLAKPLMAHEATNTTAQKVTCSGFLEKTSMDLHGKRFYRLTPDDKKIASVIYCTNEPGINLDDAVNRHVQLYGPFYLHKEVNQYYIEVLQLSIIP